MTIKIRKKKNKVKFRFKRINLVNKIVKTIFQVTNCTVDEIYFYRIERLIVVGKKYPSVINGILSSYSLHETFIG